jgi:hypothetical protein
MCQELGLQEEEALQALRFEYPVDVVSIHFAWCPCAYITLADGNGELEHFCLTWPQFRFEEKTLHYGGRCDYDPEVDDEELVQASLVLMGCWLTRSFSLDEIAHFSTTHGPQGCKSSEPEMMARTNLSLASQPGYSRLVESIICADETPQALVISQTPEQSPRIEVTKLALRPPVPSRTPGQLLND